MALAILAALPEQEGNPYYFPGRRKGKHLANIDGRWQEIRAAAKCDGLRLHDLRRTVGSWLSAAGVDLNTIKHGLRHASLSTTLTYARSEEHTSELQSLMRISYAVFCLKKKKTNN